jgi:hypothetical protein
VHCTPLHLFFWDASFNFSELHKKQTQPTQKLIKTHVTKTLINKFQLILQLIIFCGKPNPNSTPPHLWTIQGLSRLPEPHQLCRLGFPAAAALL